MNTCDTDVAIIGAGPSGAIAACLLRARGYRVTVLERARFPRFVIGESLLPQCLTVLEQADCLDAVRAAGFQTKVGATFACRDQRQTIRFDSKFSEGPSTAFHVERSRFDQILAQCAADQGAEVRFETQVTAVDVSTDGAHLACQDLVTGESAPLGARFVLDASGYGRVLPRLLNIDKPSSLPPRVTRFTHLEDRIRDADHRRNETLIVTHPVHRDVWYWLISFANGRSSIGCVGTPEFMHEYEDEDGLRRLINDEPNLSRILARAVHDTEVTTLRAWSGNVSRFAGDGYAVLGNAGEFLDPIFSSGVTIALQSSKLAVEALDRTLQGESVDWQQAYAEPLQVGIETFKCFVHGWYDGGFQDVIYSPGESQGVMSMIASVLAGYAWDQNNPYVAMPDKRLKTLMALCQGD